MEKLILFFGGRSEAAVAIGVTPSFITMVKRGKRQFSPAMALHVEKITGGKISKSELRPDIFISESNQDAA
ncbi:YdaS family helix-turn-helix protein [Methylomonas sp. AM2-LC]|uniref:transcriptional regulator n=1 Tax=Methylomonas sp. AM2-LC TaxID=3153301 RepID=UPI0032664263